MASAKAAGISTTATQGAFEAKATSDPKASLGSYVYDLVADAKSATNGAGSSGTAVAQTLFNGTTPTFDTTDQAVAQAVGLPTTDDQTTVFQNNSDIARHFTTVNSYFSIGELGGDSDAKGAASGSQTSTSTVSMTIDPSELPNQNGHIELGFFSGTAVGSGFASAVLTVQAVTGSNPPVDLLASTDNGQGYMSFVDASDAQAFFTNSAFDAGAISNIGSSPFTLQFSLTETFSDAHNGGFYGGFIAGDLPPASSSAQRASMAQAAYASQASSQPASPHAADFAKALFDGFLGNSGSAASTHVAAQTSAAHPIVTAADGPGAAASAHGRG